ncbi:MULTISPECIES: hypothetical protein [Stenotrophomonas]|uniref:Uncharacterized protein n=1 Tax=Stenotrophomonas lactitubi TaxID=2045214 RepID=A0AAW4GE39_9GAMM|nr:MULTISPECIES: hypothetical protein [Stenotrophomonas]MBM9912494.1 hypothetical protein [Stenotrophomonas lactitubi]MBM9923243.1 hypothetical protein [Stenotrophomonas lactitubi]MBM9938043.1 hypothetical protein [Stenotrophomonas lactitubi]
MTLLVIRHASPSLPRPLLPAELSGHPVLCTDCASLADVRQCLCQPQARSADWVLLDVGVADEAQWCAEGGALQAALDGLPAEYIELQSPHQPGLEARLRLQHGPAAVVVDQRSQQAGYPLSLAIVGRRLAREG